MGHHLDIADFAGASAGLRGIQWGAAARPAEKDEPVTGASAERRPKGKVKGGGKNHVISTVKLDAYAKEHPEVMAACF